MRKLESFAAELTANNYLGEFILDLGQRQAHSVDNSIYSKLPAAVAYPKSEQDLQILIRLASKYQIALTAQGGSTATVGQSLTSGILVDLQKYFTEIINFDQERALMTVAAGCTLKAVQEFLARFGYYFPVEISPSDRCSIGGMVATNAVGIGGACFGRMSANVLSVRAVLADAKIFDTADQSSSLSKKIKTELKFVAEQASIKQRAQDLPRNVGGYDLYGFLQKSNIAALFCGAEGTLGIVSSVVLKVIPKAESDLILLQHPSLEQALAEAINFSGVLASELLDHKICQVIRKQHPEFILPNLGQDEALILVSHALPKEFIKSLSSEWQARIFTAIESKQIWQFRTKAVAFISQYKEQHARRPLALIEDTAVPKHNLPAYISKLRLLLSERGLFYGMYGHIDSACIHVRPALNPMYDRELMLSLVADVRALCQEYGGVFWGEHGIGYRSEFAKDFWGAELQSAMTQVKALFDPGELLNPGKVIARDLAKFRDDWQQKPIVKDAPWLDCNGQAACLGDNSAVMCPSYRVSGNKAYSPKGRALMLRYWHMGEGASSLKDSLEKCLGCHACVSDCPVSVNIPQAKAEYLAKYYQANRRELSSWFFAKFERIFHFAAQKKYQCLLQARFEPDVYVFTDVWSYMLSPKLLRSLRGVLDSIGIAYKLLPPICVGQSAFNEGDMDEFMRAIQQASVFGMVKDKPILVLEPSVLSFLNSVWPKHAKMPAWHKNLVDVGVWLASQGLSVKPNQTIKIVGHCSELSLQPGSLLAWQQIFQQSLEILTPGCCGMAGTFGVKFANRHMSKRLFSNWRAVISRSEVVMATGCSCRLQGLRYRYKFKHPLEFLVLCKEYLNERS